jgi:cytochrome c-type protein NapB
MPEPAADSTQRRVLALLAAMAGALALIGVITGITPENYEAQRSVPREVPDPGDVPPARTHAELERHPWGSGPVASGWNESRVIARESAVDVTDREPSVDDTLAQRAARRAFDGAPPVVPHPVRPGGAPECIACHVGGFALGERRANLIPHATFASCTQCHVSSAPSLAVTALSAASVDTAPESVPAEVPSLWKGLASPIAGATVWQGAPPTVPHSTWMRERCDACHGPEGRTALQTPHPDRRSCLQCHPAVSELGSFGSR